MRSPLHHVPAAPAAEKVAQHAHVRLAESNLDRAIEAAASALAAKQRPDGHWVFELEADATISAEYVILQHFLGEPDPALEAKVASYLRRLQGRHGGWPLYFGGDLDLSATVKTYLALKLVGDSPEDEHMRRAREAILACGGAGRSNVFTRFLLALFGALPWASVPIIPVEIMLLPRWFPFHLSRVSYWSRTVLVPLLVLAALKPRARNPRGVRIDELCPKQRPRAIRWVRANHQSPAWFAVFAALDEILRLASPLFPRRIHKGAIAKAVAFVTERLNGDNGLGAIFPAMANTVMMFDALGYARSDPAMVTARAAIDRLLVVSDGEAYCQPCVSPVWDTVLACHSLLEVGSRRGRTAARRGLVWLDRRQVLDTVGDWAQQRPNVAPGGWAFQYTNPHYPDLDDTAAVVMAMDRFGRGSDARGEPDFRASIGTGTEWVLGLQSANGGWGAFDADNTSEYLNHIPFADHGALLDPPTADVTARCVSMLAQLGIDPGDPALDRGLAFLRRCQEKDGSWFGRWGMNYVYGTWSVLCALAAAGVDRDAPEIRRAVGWLRSVQNEDGGWGEGGESYSLDYRGHQRAPSTPSQTAWALLGLMAAGESRSTTIARGIEYLLQSQAADGFWPEPQFTATGFPRVFYLRYHGYAKFFPLWALARYRNLTDSGDYGERFGM
jgi:squalene-hopene/tetraprenyl-beta-curcumene cyclase